MAGKTSSTSQRFHHQKPLNPNITALNPKYQLQNYYRELDVPELNTSAATIFLGAMETAMEGR
jgi:hypothetical protein